MRSLTAIAAIGCVGLFAGCGGDDTAADQGGGAADPTNAVKCSGPVEECLGFTRQKIATASAQVENRIASCMKEQGFEYVPADPVAVQTALTGKPNMSDTEFEATFGYGISTLYGKGSQTADPNARIRGALGPAQLRAYDLTLSGGKPEQTFSHSVDTGDFSQLGGCTKTATDELFGGTSLLTTLQQKLDELDESVVADQRMVKAQGDWASCMRQATGQEFQDAEAVEESLREQFVRIVGTLLPPGQVAPAGTTVDTTALAALQRRETELATKDIECEKKTRLEVEKKVREEKEAGFRDQNADLLSKVKPLGS